jgi:hypothetical protein
VLGVGILGAATPRGRGVWVPFGSTPRPDLDRPRPWLTGVGWTGTGSTGTCTAEAVPNPPVAGATTRAGPATGTLCTGGWWPSTMLRRAGFSPMADSATPAATAQAEIAWITEMENRLRGICSRRLTRLSKPDGGSTLPNRRSVSSISECMLIAMPLPAPARLPARVAHDRAGTGWSIRLS